MSGRRVLSWLGWSLAGLLLLIVLAAGAIAAIAWSSLPRHAGEIAVDGLDGPVTIARDGHAVPTIAAASEADAYFGLGFVHAQDRLWQMEFARRVGAGRLAELLGERALPADRLMRTLGLARLAEAAAATLEPEDRRLLQAYADGINQFLATRGRFLPPEFLILRHAMEPWRIEDSLLFARVMAFDIAGEWRADLLRAAVAARLPAERFAELFPAYPADAPLTIPAALRALPAAGAALGGIADGPQGSNAFAVDGRHTASGAALLASDPHLGMPAPGVWYLARLGAGELDVTGGTLPGLPVVVIGRNRDIAWGMTTTYADTQDVFVERLVPGEAERYETPTGPAPLERRSERILVRGGADEELVVRATRNGPLLSDLPGLVDGLAPPGHALALAWTGLDEGDLTPIAGFRLARAHDWASFRAALEPFKAPVQNVIYADRHGRIGLQTAGSIPIRQGGDGRLPAEGWTGSGAWTGRVAHGELPSIVDPPSGRLVNANNPVVGAEWPHLLGRDFPPADRARRLAMLLDAAADVDLDIAAALQTDRRSTLADELLPLLLEVTPADTREREILAALASWDRRMETDRPEPLLFRAWYTRFGELVLAAGLGPLAERYGFVRTEFLRSVPSRHAHWCRGVAGGAGADCGPAVAQALRDALAALAAAYGEDWRSWRLGMAQQVRFRHRPLDAVPPLDRLFSFAIPKGGDASTPDVAGAVAEGLVRFRVGHAAGLRMLVDFADDAATRLVTATGQSGHPLSRHYRDLAALYAADGYLEPLRDATPAAVLRLVPRAAR